MSLITIHPEGIVIAPYEFKPMTCIGRLGQYSAWQDHNAYQSDNANNRLAKHILSLLRISVDTLPLKMPVGPVVLLNGYDGPLEETQINVIRSLLLQ